MLTWLIGPAILGLGLGLIAALHRSSPQQMDGAPKRQPERRRHEQPIAETADGTEVVVGAGGDGDYFGGAG
jgi:hypothetical protein